MASNIAIRIMWTVGGSTGVVLVVATAASAFEPFAENRSDNPAISAAVKLVRTRDHGRTVPTVLSMPVLETSSWRRLVASSESALLVPSSACFEFTIEDDSGGVAAYKIVSDDGSFTASGQTWSRKHTTSICPPPGACYALRVTAHKYPSEASWTFESVGGSVPFAWHFEVSDTGALTSGCSTCSCSTCAIVDLTSSAPGGGASYELRPVGGPGGAASTLLPGEYALEDKVCVDLPGGCHTFEVAGNVSSWNVGGLHGKAPYGPAYTTINKNGTVIDGCDEDIVGVCGPYADVDYVSLGIECVDLRPFTASGCLCVGAVACQSCPDGFRPLHQTEASRFVRNGTAAAFDNATEVRRVFGEKRMDAPIMVAQAHSLRVEGQGPSTSQLIATSVTRLFVVEATASLDLVNVALHNGTANDAAGGGCILIGRYAMLRLSDVALRGCFAWANGGAASIFPGSSADVTRTSSLRSQALVGDGGGFNLVSASLRLFESNLTNCHAGFYGGGVYGSQESRIYVVGTTFVGCSAGEAGGGIAVGATDDSGSLVAVSNTSRIEGCFAETLGGAIYGGTESLIFVQRTTIANCNVLGDGGGIAGDVGSIIQVASSRIERCAAIHAGGGIVAYPDSQVIVDETVIVDCDAADAGGGIGVADTTTIVVSDSRIHGCYAGDYGGGIYGDRSSHLEVKGTSVVNCTASYGGGIAGLRISVESSDIVNCTANISGGGLWGDRGSIVAVAGSSRIASCAASSDGGGILVNEDSRVYVNASNVIDCTADAGFGGGIVTSSRSIVDVVGGSQIARCDAGKHGGGVAILQHSRITMVASDILNCRASWGGGIYGSSDSVVAVLDASRLEGCSARKGGGICTALDASVAMYGSTIDACTATTYGGGIMGGVHLGGRFRYRQQHRHLWWRHRGASHLCGKLRYGQLHRELLRRWSLWFYRERIYRELVAHRKLRGVKRQRWRYVGKRPFSPFCERFEDRR